MDLTVTIAGVKFPACFMNASGALCVTHEELSALGRSRSGAIVTKSMTVEARQGNPLPRYYGFPAVRSIPWGCRTWVTVRMPS